MCSDYLQPKPFNNILLFCINKIIFCLKILEIDTVNILFNLFLLNIPFLVFINKLIDDVE